MSGKSKFLWGFGALCLLALVVIKYILGAWMPFMWGLVGGAAVGMLGALAFDFKLYVEFLFLKTTKSGLNMGVLIVLWVVVVGCLNFLGVLKDGTKDFSENRVFSLSDQSTKLVQSLQEDLQVLVFHSGVVDGGAFRRQMAQLLDLYKAEGSWVRVRFVDSYKNPALAKEYLGSQRDPKGVFVEYKNKRLRVEPDHKEPQLTQAMVKATRLEARKLVVLQGHGERSLQASQPGDVSGFRAALVEAAYDVTQVNLMQQGAEALMAASVLLILGPQQQFQPMELKALEDYIESGGRVMITWDPGARTNLEGFLSKVGLKYGGRYLIMPQMQAMGRVTSILGTHFDSAHPVTKDFKTGNALSLFDEASHLEALPDTDGISTHALVSTAPRMVFGIENLKDLNNQDAWSNTDSKVLVYMSEENTANKPSDKNAADENAANEAKEDAAESKAFRVALVGDTDFLSNQLLHQGHNRDLALNLVSYLSDDTDLISIRAPELSRTQITLTPTTGKLIVVAGVALPVLLLLLSGLSFWRRKNA